MKFKGTRNEFNMQRLLLLNGPNINRLGKREEEVYGSFTLQDIEYELENLVKEHNYEIDCFQSNYEGVLIDKLHEADENYTGIIFNPAAYTHTSIALHDAIKAINTPVIEVHISNIYQREPFRHKSMTAPACIGQITGFGIQGYLLAALALIQSKRS